MAEDPLPVWELVRTAHLAGLRFGELFAAMDLTPTQFGLLRALAVDEGLTQAELARVILVRPQSIGALVTSLRERGLVVRHGPGGRGRRAGLALTDAGREILERAWPPVREFNTPAALGLTPAQAAMLEELLERIRTALTAED